MVGHATAGWSPVECLALAAVSTSTAGGQLSADMDQYRVWRTVNRWVPDEWLGGGGPLAHRGLTHWVAWPAIMAFGWWLALGMVPVLHVVWWLGYGVAIGWASHVIMDALYGHAVRTPEGAIVVRRGVPTVLWYRHRFGVWTSSGPGSSFAGCVLTGVAVWEAWSLGVLVMAAVAGAVLMGVGELLNLTAGKPRRAVRAVARVS